MQIAFRGLDIRYKPSDKVVLVMTYADDYKKDKRDAVERHQQRGRFQTPYLQPGEVRFNGKVLGFSPIVEFMSYLLQKSNLSRDWARASLKNAFTRALDTSAASKAPLENGRTVVEAFEEALPVLLRAAQKGKFLRVLHNVNLQRREQRIVFEMPTTQRLRKRLQEGGEDQKPLKAEA